MSDLVGNPEDRFSQNETHLAADKFQTVETPAIISSHFCQITLRKHVHVLNTKFFTAVKKKKDFQMKAFHVSIIFAQNTDCVYTPH